MINSKIYKHLFVLLITVLFANGSKAETKNQRVMVALRAIGHEFLLQINDSTSRVLPIEKIDGRYVIEFEREFSFQPDLLVFSTFKVMEDANIFENYIVEVEKCETEEVIHSFKVNLNKNDNQVACALRSLPKDCYTFYFTEVNTEGIQSKESTIGSRFVYILIIGGIIVLVSVLVNYFIKKEYLKSNSDLIKIGKYQFDQKGMMLTLKAESIILSGKESDLLFLLFSNENKTLKREYILNVVWGDGGDYVGRTLDVFISKLRKKLEADSSLKIINVRGVGYRFVIN